MGSAQDWRNRIHSSLISAAPRSTRSLRLSKREQERVFDSRPDPAEPLAEEDRQEAALLAVLRRREQGRQHHGEMLLVQGALVRLLDTVGDDRGIECTPQKTLGLVRIDRHVHDRRSIDYRQLDDFAGAAPAPGRKAVPDRKQKVAMGDRGTAGHHIGFERVVCLPRKLESAGRLGK